MKSRSTLTSRLIVQKQNSLKMSHSSTAMAHKRKYDQIAYEAEATIAGKNVGLGLNLNIPNSEPDEHSNDGDNHLMTSFSTMAHKFHQGSVEVGCVMVVDCMSSGSKSDDLGLVKGDENSSDKAEYPDDATIANTDGTPTDDESHGSSLGSMEEHYTSFNAHIQHAPAAIQLLEADSLMNGHDLGNTPALYKGPKLSFIELQQERHKVLQGSPTLTSMCFSLQDASSDVKVTALLAKIQELEESKRQIELEIEACEHGIGVARKERIDQQVKVLLEHNGISTELMAEFDAFLASIEPDAGQRGGFSITCFGDHQDSYVTYDPSLAIVKENAEDDYTVCHYRWEASKVNGPCVFDESGSPELTRESVVEFWPIDAPIARASGVRTWGEQFVCNSPTLSLTIILVANIL